MKNLDDVEDYNFISVVNFAAAKTLNNYCSKDEIKAIHLKNLKMKILKQLA